MLPTKKLTKTWHESKNLYFFSTLYKIIFLIQPNIFLTLARGLHFFLYLENEYLIIWFIFSCLYNFSLYTWNMNWTSDYKYYHFVFRFLCSQDTKIVSKCAMTICNCVYYDWTTTCMFSYSMYVPNTYLYWRKKMSCVNISVQSLGTDNIF